MWRGHERANTLDDLIDLGQVVERVEHAHHPEEVPSAQSLVPVQVATHQWTGERLLCSGARGSDGFMGGNAAAAVELLCGRIGAALAALVDWHELLRTPRLSVYTRGSNSGSCNVCTAQALRSLTADAWGV